VKPILVHPAALDSCGRAVSASQPQLSGIRPRELGIEFAVNQVAEAGQQAFTGGIVKFLDVREGSEQVEVARRGVVVYLLIASLFSINTFLHRISAWL
jgi:hypothetical protein